LTSFAANLQVTLSQVAASASAGTSAEATMKTRITVAGLSACRAVRSGQFGKQQALRGYWLRS
jgi:hypothetical protein